MYGGVISKLLGESLLSFYSVFVKRINVDLTLQVWSRYFAYVVISGFFVDWVFVYKSIMSLQGVMLSIVTLAHVYASYRSFQLLDSGVATTIFYIYPIIILLMTGSRVSPVVLVSLFGVYLMANDIVHIGSPVKDRQPDMTNNNRGGDDKRGITTDKPIVKVDTNMAEYYWNEGIITAAMAAFTEALIFYLVKNMETPNNWNHLFLSYFLGAVVLTPYLWESISNMSVYSGLSVSLALNAFIGLAGYYLRFYSISRLDTYTYAVLSYFGIIMSYAYGVVLNNDVLSLQKITGTLCIVLTNIYLLYTK